MARRLTDSRSDSTQPSGSAQVARTSDSGVGLAATIGQNLPGLDTVKTAATSKASAAKSVERRQIAKTARMQRLAEPPAPRAAVLRGDDGRFTAKSVAQGTTRGAATTIARAMTPLAIAGGVSQGVNAFQGAKAKGQSNLQAGMAAATAATPTAAGLTAGAALAKFAPKVARFAGPVGLLATGAKAAYDGYQGYQKGGVTGAIRGTADSLTFGLASKAYDALAGNGDKTTMAIAKQAGQLPANASRLDGTPEMERGEGNMSRALRDRKSSIDAYDQSKRASQDAAKNLYDAAKSAGHGELRKAASQVGDAKTTAQKGVDLKRQAADYNFKADGERMLANKQGYGNTLGIPNLRSNFDAANSHFEQSHMQNSGNLMPHQPEAPAAHKGWGNKARINAAIARGVTNLPYQGDPMQGPETGQPSEEKQ